jgi:hypothetical protein
MTTKNVASRRSRRFGVTPEWRQRRTHLVEPRGGARSGAQGEGGRQVGAGSSSFDSGDDVDGRR